MILSILFYIFFLVYTFVFFAAMCVVFVLTAWWDTGRVAIYQMTRLLARGYFWLTPGWKVEIAGRENIRPGTAYVIVANHRSMLDIPLLYFLPMRSFKWVSKREVYRWPLAGWVLGLQGGIAIRRGSAASARQMIEQGEAWLGRGVSVAVFPEGSRSKTDELGKFRDGAFVMARTAGVEVLPVVLSGTGPALRGRRINFRNRFKISILPPAVAEQDVVRSSMEQARKDKNDR